VFFHHLLPRDADPRVGLLFKSSAPIFYAAVSACRFGLSLFFVLSAFLICELLVREKEATATLVVKQFYVRRVLRIWPLYYFALLFAAIFAFFSGSLAESSHEIGMYAIFMGAWYLTHNGTMTSIVFPLWSVSVEEQFYLFAPWILKYLSRKMLYGFCLALILLSNILLFHMGEVRALDASIWYNSFIQFQCFAAGILLCLRLSGRLPRFAVWQRLVLLAVSAACWFFASYGLHYQFGSAARNPGSWHLMGGYALGCLGAVIVLLAFLGMESTFIPQWAVYLGRISYGLYVFHIFSVEMIDDLFPSIRAYRMPLFILKVCTAFALNILIAAMSYKYLETRFLKLKMRHAIIESHPV
jgi:peptidoglycan/LPS O-acetylase OafA/YrhL